ncbi:Putative uncharacterized protein [Moritella viscosa]|uniref:AAA family ATPase n=1 Tax=Moritella viscosa TaxID=80854 RepID=UPI0009154A07|nr:AAA family ATPase [Moritella viscosa]SGZ08088.1 Putative uncharacterized protein [Moritella viscosa]
MQFKVITKNNYPPNSGQNTCYLKVDHWNDYSYVTSFLLSIHDDDGEYHEIGVIKIGFLEQIESEATYVALESSFPFLEDNFFSLGLDEEYYEKIYSLSEYAKNKILSSLRDVVHDKAILASVVNQEVFKVSLLRGVTITAIKGKYSRILKGLKPLTPFNFAFVSDDGYFSGSNVEFHVKEDSLPRTNVHAIIGRNGAGKTTFLKQLSDAVLNRTELGNKVIDLDSPAYFLRELDSVSESSYRIEKNYFGSVTSLSFSAFDNFNAQKDITGSDGTNYFYIGLQDPNSKLLPNGRLLPRGIEELRDDLCESLLDCFDDKKKAKRWHDAVGTLSKDNGINSLNLNLFYLCYDDFKNKYHKEVSEGEGVRTDKTEFNKICKKQFLSLLLPMSSGHMIIILSMFSLIATVDDKSLVLIDEPESHLHPPLLSAFIRAISDLLNDANGVAIIATHSPVVLQEIPQSCCWKIYRYGNATKFERPKIETFAENVGVLTNDVFKLDIERTGFYDLLIEAVSEGYSYNDTLAEFGSQLGFEGRAILLSMIANRDREQKNVEA